MSIRLLCLIGLSILVAGPASAVEVFINGVKVTGGLRNASFEKVDVKFDDKGNVVIDAPGYKIEYAQPTPPPTTPGINPTATPPAVPVPPPTAAAATTPAYPPPTAAVPAAPVEKYWLVVNTAVQGHFKIMVLANGAQIAEIPATSPQYIADITDKLVPGANQIQVTYLPSPTAPQIPPTKAVTVMIGKGSTGADGTLTIGRVLATHEKETGNPSADAATLTFDRK